MEEANVEKLEETDTIDKEKVKLNRSWSFWENYLKKEASSNNEYCNLLKEIFTFDDIISFWQFWNKYPGNDTKKIFYNGEYLKYFFKEKYRINAMNVFVNGIKPQWEDEKNKQAQILISEYDIKKDLEGFFSYINDSWIKLICLLIGEQMPHTNNINGIRVVDKSRIGKTTVFRFEIWANSSMKSDEINNLKIFLSKNLGNKEIFVKKVNN